MKWAASSGISSTRSFKAGNRMYSTLIRYRRSARNRPSWTSLSRFLLEVATKRTSKWICRFPSKADQTPFFDHPQQVDL